MSHACHRFWNCCKTSRLARCAISLRLPRKTTCERPKVLHTAQFFALLTWKCASHHNGVNFFDIATSKSGPTLRCFMHFDLEMCFAPQRRALFRQRNLVCFVHFDLEMCFAPQRRAIFHLSSDHMAPHPPLLRAYFSTLWSHKSLETHFPTFSRTCIFFLRALSLLWSSLFFASLLFSSLTLTTSAFPSVHMVGSLTSKLPSIIINYIPQMVLRGTDQVRSWGEPAWSLRDAQSGEDGPCDSRLVDPNRTPSCLRSETPPALPPNAPQYKTPKCRSPILSHDFGGCILYILVLGDGISGFNCLSVYHGLRHQTAQFDQPDLHSNEVGNTGCWALEGWHRNDD